VSDGVVKIPAMLNMPGMPGPPQNLPVKRAPASLVEVLPPAEAGGWWDAILPPWWPRKRDEWAEWWDYSCSCARTLIAGGHPPVIDVFGPVLERDEHALLSADVAYSRHYGTDAEYQPAPVVLFGRPGTMVGALAIRGLINQHRKKTAQAQAAAQWREHETAGVIVTTQRLICSLVSCGQISIWYDSAAAIYPDLEQATVTLGFEGHPPIRLSGPAAPALSLWCAFFVLGDRWYKDPRLKALFS
jgi:hypothetical protein